MFALVTGASTGIGLRTALQLAIREDYAKVVFAVRSPAKTLRSIPLSLEPKVVVLYLDLTSLESVDQFKSNLASKGITRIDRLVLNAGVNDYTNPDSRKTVDGIDEIWQVNYLSHFYLACLLRPMIPSEGRIICLSSVMHWLGQPSRFTELVRPSCERANRYYYRDSKLAMTILASELNRRFPGTISVAANPGSVASDIFRKWFVGIFGYIMRFITNCLLLSTENGAKTSIFACTDDSLKKFEYISPYGQVKGWGWIPSFLSDLYWVHVARDSKCMIGECATEVTDKEMGHMLWTLSVEAIGKTSSHRKECVEAVVSIQ